MFKKIDHIGIAVADLESAMKKYASMTGKQAAHKEIVEAQQVETVFFPVGDVRLELLNGTAEDSAITKFIEKRGEGVHHICFEVDDLEASRKRLSSQGLKFVDNVPEQGAGGTKVAFIHPKSTGGLLIELVEYPDSQKHELG